MALRQLLVVVLAAPLVWSAKSSGAPTRILFVGNSFTFVNDLPHQLLNIAQSLGEDVFVDNSTIGGCNLYHQTAPNDTRTAALLEQEWDYIVLQDYSILPTVMQARARYLTPAVKSFASQKKQAKIVMYMTWGYHDGNTAACPSSDNTKCFTLGSLASMTVPPCDTSPHFNNLAGTFSCMGYALARGYVSMLQQGADLIVPCGLSWQIVRAANATPASCKSLIDQQYSDEFQLQLPIKVQGGELPGFMLYRLLGEGGIDKHPNVAGQYLNALTFFSSLFKKSPVGAAPPLNTGSPSSGDRPLSKAEMIALQTAAYGAAVGCGKVCNNVL